MTNKTLLKTTIVSAAIGAAAGAVAIGLSNKRNRKKFGKTVADFTQKAQDLAEDVQSNPDVKKAISAGKAFIDRKGKEAVTSAKPLVRKTRKEVVSKLK